jgi:pyruvate,water dikinase
MGDFEYVKLFSELGLADVPLVGGKNASLGEMFRELTDEKIRVPDGFATVSGAYFAYLDHNDLRQKITDALASLDTSDVNRLAATGATIRGWIVDGEMPPKIASEIRAAYDRLRRDNQGRDPEVAVRSSATAEDLPDASFAGQQETYLNVTARRTPAAHLQARSRLAVHDRAIAYRVHKGFEHMAIALSAGVQRMVRSDLAASRRHVHARHRESGFPDVVMVTAAYGLGENVVQGAVNPDEFLVYKNTLAGGIARSSCAAPGLQGPPDGLRQGAR